MKKRFIGFTIAAILAVAGMGAVFIGGVEVLQRVQLIASGYINWGSTGGSSGYGVRDNAGAIEMKNSGGSWAGLLGVSGWTDDGTVVRLTTITDTVGVGTVAPVSQVDVTKTAIGATPVDTNGIRISNTTAAAAGAQQYSPPVVWQGQGWKTNATAASQKVEFMADVRPVQGAAAPTGYWGLYPSIADGAYSATPAIAVTSAGYVGVGIAAPSNLLTVGGGGDSPAITPTLRLQGYNLGPAEVGSYGGMIFSGTGSYTSSAKRFLVTNALDVNKFAIIRSVDATTDPALGAAGAVSSGTADFVINVTGSVGIGTTSPDTRFHAELDSATTNAAVAVGRLSVTSAGTPAAGLGPQLQFEVETAAGAPGNQEVVAGINGIATTVTGAAEVGELQFLTMTGGAAMTEKAAVTGLGNLTIGNPTENGNLVGGLIIKNGTAASAAVTDGIQIYARDSADSTSTLALYLEQAVEEVGTFTPANKFKIWLNGVAYWIQLDPV